MHRTATCAEQAGRAGRGSVVVIVQPGDGDRLLQFLLHRGATGGGQLLGIGAKAVEQGCCRIADLRDVHAVYEVLLS